MLKLIMDQIKYKFIKGGKKNNYKTEIVNYYNRYFPKNSNLLVMEKSSFFFIAKRDQKIIGIMRVLTDYSRYAFLLDLIVRKVERNNGVGKHLVNLVIKYCQKEKIKHIILTTDPRAKWLTHFYQKLGFKKVKNQTLMEYGL
ncbi:GNAT family N-acetyltransferase [Patescibacteria group bacterium]|nr:GNAT family N-acetyltransferase [Patescibacteria group bacterium]